MKYLVVPPAAIAVAIACLAIPTTRTSAAPKSTPTAVAIGYDEINRFAMPPATPVPPGVFQPDRAAIMAGASAAGSGDSSASPTPAPKHRGGLGGMLGAAMGGNLGGAEMGNVGNGGMAGMQSQMNAMTVGTLKRYTYYWTHNWVRTDDPVAQTAVIEKCNLHQFIYLDLAKKTYRIETTDPKACTVPANPYGGGHAPAAASAPGTADVTLTSTSSGLGPKTLESIPTNGYDTSMGMAMTNATGSCRGGNFKMETISYVSNINKQRAYCPLAGAKSGYSPTEMASRGGCKPTMHMNTSGNVHAPQDKLEMYIRTMMGNPTGGRGGIDTVLERGNVDWYPKAQADALFSIPPGFTQSDQTQ